MLLQFVSFCSSIHCLNLSLNFNSRQMSMIDPFFSLPIGSRKTNLYINSLHATKSWNHFLFSSHSTQNHDIQLNNLHFSNFLTKPFLLANYQISTIVDSVFNGSVVGKSLSDIEFLNQRNALINNFNVTNCSFIDCKDQKNDASQQYCYNGGAFYLNLRSDSNVLFCQSNFTRCEASFRGGAIFISAPTTNTISINFTLCLFKNCNITRGPFLTNPTFQSGGYGAAVVVNAAKNVFFKYVSFLNNSWFLGNNESLSYYNSLFIGNCHFVNISDVTFQTYKDGFNKDFKFKIYDLGLNNIFEKLSFSRCCFASNDTNISSINVYSGKWPSICSFQNCFFSQNMNATGSLGIIIPLSGVYTFNIVINNNNECGFQTPTPSLDFINSEAFTQTNLFSESWDFTESASLVPNIIDSLSESNFDEETTAENDETIADLSKSSVLSTGEISGIAIGCVALLAIIIALLVYFCRSKPKAFRPPNADPTNIDGFDVPII